MLLASLVVMSLNADPTAWVVLSRRSGVTRTQALELTRSLSARLSTEGLKLLPPEDLSSCGGKVPCLMAKARAAGAEAMICVDAASVLDEQLVSMTLYSVEEDGKRIEQVNFEGPRAQWSAERVDGLLAPLKHVLGLDAVATPPPAPLPAAPVVAAPPAEAPPVAAPAPTVIVSPPPPARRSTKPRWLAVTVMVLGGVGLVTASGLGIASMTAAGQRYRLCPADAYCSDLDAYAAYDRAVTAQNAGWAALGVGVGLVALGAILFLIFRE